MSEDIKKILDKLKSDNYPFGIATIDINKLYDYITNLQEELQQKENIMKEVREYIKNLTNFQIGYGLNENDIKRTMYASENDFVKELLKILDKKD